jgi:hypothetical protein
MNCSVLWTSTIWLLYSESYNVDDDVPDELELGTVSFLSSMDGRERRSCCNEQSPRPA